MLCQIYDFGGIEAPCWDVEEHFDELESTGNFWRTALPWYPLRSGSIFSLVAGWKPQGPPTQPNQEGWSIRRAAGEEERCEFLVEKRGAGPGQEPGESRTGYRGGRALEEDLGWPRAPRGPNDPLADTILNSLGDGGEAPDKGAPALGEGEPPGESGEVCGARGARSVFGEFLGTSGLTRSSEKGGHGAL